MTRRNNNRARRQRSNKCNHVCRDTMNLYGGSCTFEEAEGRVLFRWQYPNQPQGMPPSVLNVSVPNQEVGDLDQVALAFTVQEQLLAMYNPTFMIGRVPLTQDLIDDINAFRPTIQIPSMQNEVAVSRREDEAFLGSTVSWTAQTHVSEVTRAHERAQRLCGWLEEQLGGRVNVISTMGEVAVRYVWRPQDINREFSYLLSEQDLMAEGVDIGSPIVDDFRRMASLTRNENARIMGVGILDTVSVGYGEPIYDRYGRLVGSVSDWRTRLDSNDYSMTPSCRLDLTIELDVSSVMARRVDNESRMREIDDPSGRGPRDIDFMPLMELTQDNEGRDFVRRVIDRAGTPVPEEVLYSTPSMSPDPFTIAEFFEDDGTV